MVYHIQKYWGFGLFPSSGILGTTKQDVRKLDLFPTSGVGGKTPTQLGPLELIFLVPRIPDDGKSRNPQYI
jgi:hypothetical protein